jgi:hypothetical protein
MTVTVSERKARLGHGATAKITRQARRAHGHTWQVLFAGRRDPVVERAAARYVSRKEKRPVTVEELFPEYYENQTASSAPTPS